MVGDLEKAIERQRDEWRSSIDLFESQYERGGVFGASSANSSRALNVTSLLSRGEIKKRLREVRQNVAEIGQEIEDDLSLFKRRWAGTREKSGDRLPLEIRELSSLSDLRKYVGDSLSEGRVPALLSRRRRGAAKKAKDAADPLGASRAAQAARVACVTHALDRRDSYTPHRLDHPHVARDRTLPSTVHHTALDPRAGVVDSRTAIDHTTPALHRVAPALDPQPAAPCGRPAAAG